MYENNRSRYDPNYDVDHGDKDWREGRKRRYPFDDDPRYDYAQSHDENGGNKRLSWYDSNAENGGSGIQTSIDYHHGLSVDGPQQQQQQQDVSDLHRDRASEKWKIDRPTQTVFLGGVPRFVGEADICQELEEAGFSYRDVRMARHKDTGANRGFAFVEFHSVDDARRWMEHNQGYLRLRDGNRGTRTIALDYSHTAQSAVEFAPPPPRQPLPAPPRPRDNDRYGDWHCVKCGYNNFRRRERCMRCNLHRDECERLRGEDGFDQVGSNPCNTLLLRGLDAMTSESSIMHGLSQVSDIPLKSICVMRSPDTGLSLGYAFVELHSLRDSGVLLDIVIQLPYPLDIDGKAVIIGYARNTFSTVMSYLADQHHNCHGFSEHSSYNDHQRNKLSRHADDTWQSEGCSDIADSQAWDTRQPTSTASTTDATNNTDNVPALAAAAVPDVTTFTYDESSGYYYDAVTGYYYDAGTQYFYNPESCQFLYWNYETQSYHPVTVDGNSEGQTEDVSAEPTSTDNDSTENKSDAEKKSDSAAASSPTLSDDKAKKEKALHAKKIVKDMERWAKVQNIQKESAISSPSSVSSAGFKKPLAPISAAVRSKESAAADAGFAVLSKAKTSTKTDKFTMEIMKGRDDKRPLSKVTQEKKVQPAVSGPLGLVASYGDSDSESEDEPEPPTHSEPATAPQVEWDAAAVEEKMTDWPKLTCLLCKRLFHSRDVLLKHQQLSELHKSNLEELRLQSSAKRR